MAGLDLAGKVAPLNESAVVYSRSQMVAEKGFHNCATQRVKQFPCKEGECFFL